MFLIFYFSFIISLIIYDGEAINPQKCNSNVETRCVVPEHATFSSWYAYDQAAKTCILIRWSDECDSPGNNVNIYSSHKECADECDRELKARRND